MKAIFRIECEIGAGFVEAVVADPPFVPSIGMSIAPLAGADALLVEDVFWFSEKPGELEVWLKNDEAGLRPWAYWKKQGFKKGEQPAKAIGSPA